MAFLFHAEHHVDYHTTQLVSDARKVVESKVPARQILGVVSVLLRDFGGLYDLQLRLIKTEAECRLSAHQQPDGSYLWDDDQLRTGIADLLATISALSFKCEQVDDSDALTDLVQQAEAIQSKWKNLNKPISNAFEFLFPAIQGTVSTAFAGYEFKRLIKKVNFRFVSEGVDEETRVFLPLALLQRFLVVAFENLETAAYNGWKEEQVGSDALVSLEYVAQTLSSGSPGISLRIVDNGPMIEHDCGSGGSRSGLDGIKMMATYYDAELIPPHIDKENGRTTVELRMRHRLRQQGENGT
jgi:hypothetical protein